MPRTVSLSTLWKNYPDTKIKKEALFNEFGWNDLKDDENYRNTCAIRMSYCLIKSGITVPGRLQIKRGIHKGKWIEPGQVKLSKILSTNVYFGKPIIFKAKDSEKVLENKQGIISFMNMSSYPLPDGGFGGHIDLIKHDRFLLFWDRLICGSGCYWDAATCWFWPLSM